LKGADCSGTVFLGGKEPAETHFTPRGERREKTRFGYEQGQEAKGQKQVLGSKRNNCKREKTCFQKKSQVRKNQKQSLTSRKVKGKIGKTRYQSTRSKAACWFDEEAG